MTSHIGELAALATAVCWTVSALAFAAGGKRIGSLSVNLIRLVLAFVFLCAITSFSRGLPLPTDARDDMWFWFGISGFVGFFLGDLFLFKALVLLGPRLAMLLMCLWPPLAALGSWLAFGRHLTVVNLVGMAVTLAGVAWVTLENREEDGEDRQSDAEAAAARRHALRGVVLAILGAVGQAGGYVLSSVMIKEYDAFAATQIRLLAGVAGFVVLFTALRAWPRLWEARRHPRALGLVALGAFFGPCLGVALSLYALKFVPEGVAATLASTTPVLIIPAVAVVHKERVSRRAILGACLAVAGVALLFIE